MLPLIFGLFDFEEGELLMAILLIALSYLILVLLNALIYVIHKVATDFQAFRAIRKAQGKLSNPEQKSL